MITLAAAPTHDPNAPTMAPMTDAAISVGVGVGVARGVVGSARARARTRARRSRSPPDVCPHLSNSFHRGGTHILARARRGVAVARAQSDRSARPPTPRAIATPYPSTFERARGVGGRVETRTW